MNVESLSRGEEEILTLLEERAIKVPVETARRFR
jgi:hypothetical protein